MAKLTIGVIGAGMIGRRHLRTIPQHPDFALVGIADTNTKMVSEEYPDAAVFADYRDLLTRAKPAVVIIASPNQVHAEIGIACARLGIHFLIEKPVTDTLEAASGLIEEVRKAGVHTLVGHHRRHHEQVKAVRAILQGRQLGTIVGVSAIWAVHKPDSYFAAGRWRAEPGGGPILINLIHEIDFLRFTLGEIAAVSAIASNRHRGFPVEDTAAAILQFESGAIGTMLLSDCAVSPWTMEQGLGESVDFPVSDQSSYRFIGRKGAIEFPTLVQWTQAGDVQDWNQAIEAQRLPTGRVDPFMAQLDHLRDVVRGLVPSLQDVEDGARTLAATLAVTEEASTSFLKKRSKKLLSMAAEPNE